MDAGFLRQNREKCISITFADSKTDTYTLRDFMCFGASCGVLKLVSAILSAGALPATTREIPIRMPVAKDVFEIVCCLLRTSKHPLCDLQPENLYRILAAADYLRIAKAHRQRFHKNLAKKSVMGAGADKFYARVYGDVVPDDVAAGHKVPLPVYLDVMAGILVTQNKLGFECDSKGNICPQHVRDWQSKYNYDKYSFVPERINTTAGAASILNSTSSPIFWKAFAWVCWHQGHSRCDE